MKGAPTATAASTLTPEEIERFCRDGYLVKRDILDPELAARALDYIWDRTPASFDRNDWRSWTGEVDDAHGRRSLDALFGRFKLRGETRSEPFLLELLPRNPKVWSMAEQLLGEGAVLPPSKIRGIYSTFPVEAAAQHPRAWAHLDRHPFHLGAVGYLDEIVPGGGGFTVWPGSHHLLYPEFRASLAYQPGPGLEARLASVNREEGLEIHAPAGTVILWHHRLAHAPGRNRTHLVRPAVLCDLKRRDYEETQAQPPLSPWDRWEGIDGAHGSPR
jgi:Phytanoyl-CoA dioxygenase (PhyH)